MYKTTSKSNDLYLVANVDDDGNVINYPMGGGSSTKSSIKAFDNLTSAKKSLRFFPGSKIVKVTGFEKVEL